MNKRIIVIDDEPLMSNLIKELIEEEPGLEVVATAQSIEAFLEHLTQGQFDVAVMDISMREREGGLEILKMLQERHIHLPVVVLSGHEELHYGLKSLQCGAKAYVNKMHIVTDLVLALKQVMEGNIYVSGENKSYILGQFERQARR